MCVAFVFVSIYLAVALNKFSNNQNAMNNVITVYLRLVLVVCAFRHSSFHQRSTFILSFIFREFMFTLPLVSYFV